MTIRSTIRATFRAATALALVAPWAAAQRPTVSVDFELEAAAYRESVTEPEVPAFEADMSEQMAGVLGGYVGFLRFRPAFEPGYPLLRIRLSTVPRNAGPLKDKVPTRFYLALALAEGGEVFTDDFEFRPDEQYRDEIAVSQLSDPLRVGSIPNRFEAIVLGDRLLGGLLSRVSLLGAQEGEAPPQGYFAAGADRDGAFQGFFLLKNNLKDFAALPRSKFEVECSLPAGTFGREAVRTRLIGMNWPDSFSDLKSVAPDAYHDGTFTQEDVDWTRGLAVPKPAEGGAAVEEDTQAQADTPPAPKTVLDARYVGLKEIWERKRPPAPAGESHPPAPVDGFFRELQIEGLYVAHYIPREDALLHHSPAGVASQGP
ncbi:MAG: hypothetical protein AAF682_31605 [Planctomycetota bacterium]